MKYKRFEDLPVWREARTLGSRILIMGDHRYFRGRRGFRDQLERAAVSVSNNIAEGFEQGTTAALITYIYYARGSAGEVRSMLWILGDALGEQGKGGSGAADRPDAPGIEEPENFEFEISNLKFQKPASSAGARSSQPLSSRFLVDVSDLQTEAAVLIPVCGSIGRQLCGWADHLQNTPIKGQRHLTDAVRAEQERRARAAAFIDHLNSLNPRSRKDGQG